MLNVSTNAGGARGLDVTGLTLRGFTYQAVGQLAQRQPQAFAGRTDIAARWGLWWVMDCAGMACVCTAAGLCTAWSRLALYAPALLQPNILQRAAKMAPPVRVIACRFFSALVCVLLYAAANMFKSLLECFTTPPMPAGSFQPWPPSRRACGRRCRRPQPAWPPLSGAYSPCCAALLRHTFLCVSVAARGCCTEPAC